MKKILHECYIESTMLPIGVTMLEENRRCEVCGQRWAISWFASGSSVAIRIRTPFFNFKKWKYQRKMRNILR